jgi:RHS repeat-associated protein
VQTKRWADVTIPIADINLYGRIVGRTNTLDDNNEPNWTRGGLLNTSKTYYDAGGQVKRSEVEDENGQFQPTYYEYDTAGRQSAVIDALGYRTEYEYQGHRRVLTRDARNNVTRFVHDALGRVIETEYPDGQSAHKRYSSLGNVTYATDHAGRTRRFEYNVGARLSAVVLPAVEDPEDGYELAHPRYEYEYDDYGNLITITDKLKQDPNTNDVDANSARYTRFTYSELGQQTSRKLPSGKVETKQYNEHGQLIKSTDFKGQVTRYYYDDPNAPGRLSQQRYYHDNAVDANEPNLIITAIHDKLGRRMRVDINDVDNETLAHYRWWYDEQGRVKTILALDHFVAYEHHGNTGRQKSVRTPQQEADTKARYYYDELGRLAEVEAEKLNGQDSNDITYYAYNPVGSLETVTYPNGNVSEYTYNAVNRLTNLTNWQTSAKLTPLSSYQYTLSPDGQRTKAIETTAAGSTEIAWTYDDLNRLIAEDYNAPGDVNDYQHEYVHDMVGNRLERNVLGSDPNTTYSYNDNDQLTWETTDGNTITYGYDDNGALILRDSNDGDDVTYAYDLRGRLAQADIEDGPTAAYLYNPGGIRVRATVDGNDIDYIIDPYNHTGYAQVLKEINGVTGTNRVYITGLDVVAQATGSNSPKYLLYDGHGSVRQLANNVGNVVANYHYDGYGKALNFNPAQAATQLLYAGEMIDPQTGLYNNRRRWYNPTIGRFNRMDEFGGSNRDPQSLHKYLYAHCNPVTNTDPGGKSILLSFLFGSGNAFSIHAIYDEIVQGVGYTIETMIYGCWAGYSTNMIVWQATLGVVIIPALMLGIPAIIGRLFGRRAATWAARFLQIAQAFPLMMSVTGASDYIPKLAEGADNRPRGQLRQNMLNHTSTQGLDVRAHHLVSYRFRDHEVIRGINMDINHASNGIFLGQEHHLGDHSQYRRAMLRELDHIAMLPRNQWEPEVVRLRNNSAIALYHGAPLLARHGARRGAWYKVFKARR